MQKKKLQGHKNLLAILMDSKVICGSNKKIKTYLAALKFLKQKKSVLTEVITIVRVILFFVNFKMNKGKISQKK